MLSRQYASLMLLLAPILILTCHAHASGDVLVERDSTIFGKINQVTNREVSIARGCNNGDVQTVPKERVKYYQFDSSCQPHKFVLPTSPLQLCDQPKQQMYKAYFKGQKAEVYATDLLLGNDKIIRLQLAKESGSIQGLISKIRSIIPISACLKSVPDKQTWPKEFCHEPPVWAVNFSLKPVYNNKIFTKGFTFFLDEIGGKSSDVSIQDVRRAFGAALTLWSSRLLMLRPKLDPQLASYVDSAVAHSRSATLFVPPQVIQVECPQNALMIVKIYHTRYGNLFPENSGYVAKAQLEGRTILLNGVDFQYRSELDVRAFLKDHKVNLTTVFAHEIGHSFGLPDIDDATQTASVMNANSIANNLAGGPTDVDGLALIEILKKAVTGMRPGEFNPTECAGLRLSMRH